jgi:hypothetical protein
VHLPEQFRQILRVDVPERVGVSTVTAEQLRQSRTIGDLVSWPVPGETANAGDPLRLLKSGVLLGELAGGWFPDSLIGLPLHSLLVGPETDTGTDADLIDSDGRRSETSTRNTTSRLVPGKFQRVTRTGIARPSEPIRSASVPVSVSGPTSRLCSGRPISESGNQPPASSTAAMFAWTTTPASQTSAGDSGNEISGNEISGGNEVWTNEVSVKGTDAGAIDASALDRPGRNAARGRPGAVHAASRGFSDTGTKSARSARSPTAPPFRCANRHQRLDSGNDVSQPCRVH